MSRLSHHAVSRSFTCGPWSVPKAPEMEKHHHDPPPPGRCPARGCAGPGAQDLPDLRPRRRGAGIHRPRAWVWSLLLQGTATSAFSAKILTSSCPASMRRSNAKKIANTERTAGRGPAAQIHLPGNRSEQGGTRVLPGSGIGASPWGRVAETGSSPARGNASRKIPTLGIAGLGPPGGSRASISSLIFADSLLMAS